MGNWGDYQREEVTRVKAGNHRVCIIDVEDTVSKTSGTPMIVVTVLVNGSNIEVKNYIVKNEYFNKNMTSFFDSFAGDIEEGDFDFAKWIGAMGAAKLIEDDQGYLKIRYFINKEDAEKLPEWEGERPAKNEISTLKESVEDDNLPF